LNKHKFSHVDESGKVKMVDVGDKDTQERYAVARGKVFASCETLKMISNNEHKKGDVLTVAHIAGIQAAKKTAELIPLCHPLLLNSVKLLFSVESDHVLVECTVRVNAKTGVEMEALTGASVACLAIYDMCKAVDKRMVLGDIRVMEKFGGRSGHFLHSE